MDGHLYASFGVAHACCGIRLHVHGDLLFASGRETHEGT